jgi:3-oxoacyl-ACP reductase-like protein
MPFALQFLFDSAEDSFGKQSRAEVWTKSETQPGEKSSGVLAGKVAIIRGGGRGIGRAIAAGYVREGARVVVTAAQERSEIESFAESWGADHTLAVVADVTDPAGCERVVAASRMARADFIYVEGRRTDWQ